MRNVILCFIVFIVFNTKYYAQVGIGTTEPKATLHVVGNPTNPSTPDGILLPNLTRNNLTNKSGYGVNQAGTMVYVTEASGTTNTQTVLITDKGSYFFNGFNWVKLLKNRIGDIKTGIQTNDHKGWVLLNGRVIYWHLTPSQQANAIALGFTWTIPNAAGRVLMQNNNTLGSVSGNNTMSIQRQHLPNISFTGNTNMSGFHRHGSNTSTNGGQYGLIRISNIGLNTHRPSGLVANPGMPDLLSQAVPIAIQSDGNHSHVVNLSSGGSSVPIDRTLRNLSVNTFLYLGE